MKTRNRGFTLIELLIVVAIIAILAAIAVPNFLEAQTRSKVSRVKADERSLATALQAYHVDQNDYPPSHAGTTGGTLGSSTNYLNILSTPVSYITFGRVEDPFGNQEFNYVPGYGQKSIYFYARMETGDLWFDLFTGPGSAFANGVGTQNYDAAHALLDDSEFMIMSAGPDRLFLQQWHQSQGAGAFESYSLRYVDLVLLRGQYDPTNGTISLGDITRTNRGVLLHGGIK